jgi:hypothetical protein
MSQPTSQQLLDSSLGSEEYALPLAELGPAIAREASEAVTSGRNCADGALAAASEADA